MPTLRSWEGVGKTDSSDNNSSGGDSFVELGLNAVPTTLGTRFLSSSRFQLIGVH